MFRAVGVTHIILVCSVGVNFARQLWDNCCIFVVERVPRGHRYLYRGERPRGRGETVRQRTVKALGRKDALAAGGELDRLAASIVRHSERSLILSDIDAGRIESRRIGGPFLAAGCLCSMEQPGCLEGIVDPALVGHRHREAKRTGALADHGAIGS